ncbi:MAG: D-glycero-beta-D-manno-heptose 1-phosphate adenylyltransferase [Candidatus Cloacimonadaceae bacterium]|nr:D-glycero-beta-D-manno-heptose 1-phosphate adenylyltransferase [Candidatus Cloacimonadaceae bacterium]
MIAAKMKTWKQIEGLVAKLRSENKSIVFSNGCFDIIHAGHAVYLNQAKGLGDVLIIGLNSDASVRRLKGEFRPIVDQVNRAIVLAALESVDYVVIFDEDTPYELIKLIQPDILVKGGDWRTDQIVGADIVTARGGRVESIQYNEGLSSTNIITRIKSL